jgi:glycosyltransferase involved in cell wall biosynthesis
VRIVLILPPSKTSHEIDTLRAIPGSEVVVIADPAHHAAPTHALSSVRLPWLGSPRRWTAALAWLRRLDHVDLAGGADVVVSLELFSVATRQASRFARRRGLPHLVYVTEILDSNPLYRVPPWRGNARRASRLADGALCWNRAGARHAIARGVSPDAVFVTSPGVDTEVFHPSITGENSRPPVAISVGELRADKGVLDVIAAADLVAARVQGFRLVLVGDGPLRDTVDQLAGSRPWLEVRGRLSRDRVADELRAASTFVLAPRSRRFWAEQLGFAVVEAMACGLPVVVTACGALPEVVPEHNYVVPEGDLRRLADGIVATLGPNGHDLGRRNLRAVEQHFTLATQGAALGDVIERVLHQ